MPEINYIDYEGTLRSVDVPVDSSVMRGAVDNGIPGIDADCGGEAACATCHVFVQQDWMDVVGPPEPGSAEESMLSFAEGVGPSSRLSCQIVVTDELGGLVVTTPEFQH
jgi:2Fe-2S ferredoxin